MENYCYSVGDWIHIVKGWPEKAAINAAKWKVLMWLWDDIQSDVQMSEFEAKKNELDDTIEAVLLGHKGLKQGELDLQDSCPR